MKALAAHTALAPYLANDFRLCGGFYRPSGTDPVLER
jgi:hypothetical protein